MGHLAVCTLSWIAILLLVGVQVSYSAPLPSGSNAIPETNVTVSSLEWLQRFGYFVRPDPRLGALLSEESIANSIKELQRFAGLQETGTIDGPTAELMRKDRCGDPDFGPMDLAKKRRKRRFTLQGTSWSKSHLTWRLTNANNDGLPSELVESLLERAFAKWAAVTKMTFSKLSEGEADIMISFNRGYHRDPNPFDGRSGTLAHAFFPLDNKGISGDIHFDDDEEFTVNSLMGSNFFSVAFHEIGHSLGLEHSNLKKAVMYPWYQLYDGTELELTEDDITGIQQIYGPPEVTTPSPSTPSSNAPTVSPTTTRAPPVVCIKEVGAVFLSNDERTHVINNDKLYILFKSNLGIEKGPLLVSEYFPNVSHVDAAYRSGDGHVVLFSGQDVHIFNEGQRVSGPDPISKVYSGFPSDVPKVDAAMVWPGNGRTYLFAGEYYWRYDAVSQKIDYGYPRKITTAWGGIPANVDAAFTWSNGVTYFFKGKDYYRLQKSMPIKIENGYPRNIQTNWIRCRDSNGVGATGAAASVTLSYRVGAATLLLSALYLLAF